MSRRFAALLLALSVVLPPGLASAYPTGGALPPQLRDVVQITGVAGVPDDAVGVALNVTVAEPLASGFLTVFPCGDRPLASNLNYVAGQTVPNFVISGLDEDGQVCIETMATTDVIVDIAGYLPAGSPLMPLDAPRRFLDTRAGVGAPTARVASLSVLAVPVAGANGVPADASTVVFNATAVQPSGDGFLTVFPCGQPIPETSTLNFTSGGIVPNLVVSAVGANGSVCFLSNVETDIVADVAAFTAADVDGLEMLDRPHRLVDTRIGLGGPLLPLGPPSRPVAVANQFGVPADASAAIVNLTATNGAEAGYAAAYPCGGTVPFVSNLNFTTGANVANLAIVGLAGDGSFCLTANRNVDMVVDVLGYVQGTAAIVPLTPERVYDSREGSGPTCNMGARINGGVAEIVDFATGAVTPLAGAPALDQSRPPSPRILIAPNCNVYLTIGYGDDATNSPRSFLFDRHGVLLTSTMVVWDYTAFTTPFGLFYIRQGYNQEPQVISWDTGQVVFDLPNMGQAQGNGNPLRLWRPIGASDDGSLIALKVVEPDGIGQMVAYFTIAGDEIGIFSFGIDGDPVAMSPDGIYLAWLTSGSNPADVGLLVTTVFGTEIVRDTSGSRWAYSVTPTFMGRGSIYGCFGTAVRWDLFSPPVPVLPAQPAPCPIAAR